MAASMRKLRLSVLCISLLILCFYGVVKEVRGHGDHGHGHHHGHSHDHSGGHHGHGHSHGHSHSHGHGHSPGDNTQHDHTPHHQQDKHEHGHSHGDDAARAEQKQTGRTPDRFQMWYEAIGATVLISAAPYLILFIIPLDKNRPGQEQLLKVLLSFASGGLLGDAFLHLIPHAISPHGVGEEHDHGHSHEEDEGHGHGHDHTRDMMVGMYVLSGIIIFLAVEKFVRHVKGEHGHSHGGSHVHDGPTATEIKKGTDGTELKQRKKGDKKSEDDKATAEHTDEDDDSIKVAGFLNLAADCMHNFTDGLAIGASFLVGRPLGLVTTVTILLHEIPHEIGDFAILVQSGCSKRKAMMLQLVTAVGALAGCIFALLTEGSGQSNTWILPLTAGGFIYIATVTVIPELLEDSKPKQSILEILALLAGVALMVMIALYE